MENIFIMGGANTALVGKTFIDVGEERGLDPWEALREVTLEERANFNLLADGIGGDLYHDPEKKHFDAMIEHSLCFNSVDAVFDSQGRSWLEAYGALPRIIDRYVKRKRSLTLREVIERFSSRVAERFGITDRGFLREDCYADIVVFDLADMRDHPVLFEGAPRHATGVEYLLMNGTLVIEEGRANKVLPGKIITRR